MTFCYGIRSQPIVNIVCMFPGIGRHRVGPRNAERQGQEEENGERHKLFHIKCNMYEWLCL